MVEGHTIIFCKLCVILRSRELRVLDGPVQEIQSVYYMWADKSQAAGFKECVCLYFGNNNKAIPRRNQNPQFTLCFNYLRGGILNKIYGSHKNLTGIYFAISTINNNTWSYLLWSHVMLVRHHIWL